MIQLIMNVVSIIFGLFLIVCRKFFAKEVVNFSYNLTHRHFCDERVYQIISVISGIIFIILGILSLCGTIKSR